MSVVIIKDGVDEKYQQVLKDGTYHVTVGRIRWNRDGTVKSITLYWDDPAYGGRPAGEQVLGGKALLEFTEAFKFAGIGGNATLSIVNGSVYEVSVA